MQGSVGVPFQEAVMSEHHKPCSFRKIASELVGDPEQHEITQMAEALDRAVAERPKPPDARRDASEAQVLPFRPAR